MKRIWAVFLTFILLVGLAVPALAADEQSFTFTLKANDASSSTIKVGDEVTVQLTVSQDQGTSYRMYAAQDEIIYDKKYFSYVDGSLTVFEGFKGGFRDSLYDGTTRAKVLVSYVDMTGQGTERAKSIVAATFRLKAVEAGSTSLANDAMIITDQSAARLSVAGQEAVVTIQSAGGSPGGSGGGSGGSGSTEQVPQTPGSLVPAPSGYNTVKGTTTLAATTDAAGKASGTVTQQQIAAAVAQATAGASGTGVKPVVEIQVTAAADAKTVETSIPAAALTEMINGQIQEMTLSTPIAALTFDRETLEGFGDGDITITAGKVDVSTLPAQTQSQVGDRPVFNFSVQSGGQTISQFDGNVTVSVPYTPAAEEDLNAIVIYYINAQGELEMVENCLYDAESGTVIFKTDHFSQYAVGYNKVRFSDVSGWYEEYVSYLSARGIVKGVSGDRFEPGANITRAQAVQILGNMAGADLSLIGDMPFTDVKASDWFAGAVSWAYKQGIAQGSGNRFYPGDFITREDLSTMLARYLEQVAKTTLPETVDRAAFKDDGSISGYAKDAVYAMQQAGIISGSTGNMFLPKNNASRAECSKMVTQIMKLLATQ